MLDTVGYMDEVISVKRTSAIYNAHSYLTKVPEQAIIPFLKNFTEPGDLVVDPFAGSGMTGVAALITGRRALLSDISRLGQHIGQNYIRIVNTDKLLQLGEKLAEYVKKRHEDDYSTKCMKCGGKGEIRRLV